MSYAAERGYNTLIQGLLTTIGVDIQSKDNQYGRTPLSWAALKGYEAVVRLLLDTGKADAESRDNSGLTPLLCAVWGGARPPRGC